MGIFNLLKKLSDISNAASAKNAKNKPKVVFTETINGKSSKIKPSAAYDDEIPTDFEHLDKDGDLPFGWIFRNREFTEKIGGEYSYFLNMWLANRKGSPKEHYQTLKSFVLYLEDAGKLCKSKGECFELWFYEYLTSKDYIEKRKSELDKLTANFDDLQKKYEKNILVEEKIQTIKPSVIILLQENDGILQSDFYKLFDDEICRAAASNIVNALVKEGKVERTKTGKSYILHYK